MTHREIREYPGHNGHVGYTITPTPPPRPAMPGEQLYAYTRCTDGTSEHKMEHTRRLGRCFNRYTCTRCGGINDVDSSD